MKYSTELVMQTYIEECIKGNISKEDLGEELIDHIRNHSEKHVGFVEKETIHIDPNLILEIFNEEKWLLIQIEYLPLNELQKLYPNQLHPITHYETIETAFNKRNYEKLIYLFNLAALYDILRYRMYYPEFTICTTEDFCYKYGPDALEFIESKAFARWENTFVFKVSYDTYISYLAKAREFAEPFYTNAMNLQKELNLSINEFVHYDYQNKVYTLKSIDLDITSETPEGLKEKYKEYTSKFDRF